MNREKIHERSKAMYGKSKGFMAEFSTFIMRGNVMDMAVGVIVGAAFQKIISSLVDDIIMPVISMLIGGIDFSNSCLWTVPITRRLQQQKKQELQL